MRNMGMRLLVVGMTVFALTGCSADDPGIRDLRLLGSVLGSPQMQSYGQCVSEKSNERLPGGFLAYPGYSAFGACSAAGDDE